jgi:hypothetical protein
MVLSRRIGTFVAFGAMLLSAAVRDHAAEAQIIFYSGNDLATHCSSSNANPLLCLGLVIGMQDGLVIARTGVPPKYCSPDQVKIPQILDITTAYLQRHPETRHLAAAHLVDLALIEAFPCQQRR